ncbi:MAG: hypothetical protein CBB72_011325 [Muricauda sp. TMED12]|nr:MAG: hypothetical protein CBB72_011325 [Muricauda sp. TMED12]
MSKARDLSDFISTATVDATEIADGAVTTAKVSDANITHAKLHTDMNLSGKTITLADDQISGNKIHGGTISNFASAGIDDNASGTAVTITNAGNVGIGATSPNTKLHVKSGGAGNSYGSLYLQVDTATNYPAMVIQTATGGNSTETHGLYIKNTAAGYGLRIDDTSGDTSPFVVDTEGRVGIGTTSPATQLHVDGNGSAVELRVAQNGTYYTDIGINHIDVYNNDLRIMMGGSEKWRFKSGGDLHASSAQEVKSGDKSAIGYEAFFGANSLRFNRDGDSYIDTRGTNNNLKFRHNSSYDTAMTILGSNGNVGIGTTSPNAKLHIKEDASTAFSASGSSWHNIVVSNENTSAAARTAGIAFELNGYHVNAGTGIAAVKNGTASDYGADLVFITRPQSAVAEERMRIDSSGGLTVGATAAPSGAGGVVQFFLKQSAASNGIASVANGNDAYIRMYHTGSVGVLDTTYGTSGGYTPLTFRTNGSERMRIDNSGDLIINNNVNNAKLLFRDQSNSTGIYLQQIGSSGSPALRFYDSAAGSERLRITSDRLSVGANLNATTGKRGVRVGRTVINWFNYGSQNSATYLHIKTDLVNIVGSNPQPTMSMFHIRGYTYGAQNIDSMLGFHNWSGTYYNTAYTNNGHRTVVSSSWAPYRSTDNKVVIVLNLGVNSYAGVSIDYMQNYQYTWQDVEVLAYSRSTNTSGVY